MQEAEAALAQAGARSGAARSSPASGLGSSTSWPWRPSGCGRTLPRRSFGAPLAAGSVAAEISPELLGVGYIIGPKIAATMAAGGVLAYLVLIPAIHFFGSVASGPIAPGTTPIALMSPDDIRSAYVLYIGAGAVATGGVISLVRSLPMIWRGLAGGLAAWRTRNGRSSGEPTPRTDQDLPPRFVALGLVGLVGAILVFHSLRMNIVGALLIVLFGFLFVTVSSRLTGQIGSSSNPISGMTVATLLLTCLIFLALGWTGPTYYVTALSVGGIVCIAAANGGDHVPGSQDRLSDRLDAALPADRHSVRSARLGVGPGTGSVGLERRLHGLCAGRQRFRAAFRRGEGPHPASGVVASSRCRAGEPAA